MDFHVAMKQQQHPLTHTSFCVTWIAALLALCTAAQSSMRSCLRGEPQETKRLQGVIYKIPWPFGQAKNTPVFLEVKPPKQMGATTLKKHTNYTKRPNVQMGDKCVKSWVSKRLFVDPPHSLAIGFPELGNNVITGYNGIFDYASMWILDLEVQTPQKAIPPRYNWISRVVTATLI